MQNVTVPTIFLELYLVIYFDMILKIYSLVRFERYIHGGYRDGFSQEIKGDHKVLSLIEMTGRYWKLLKWL